MSSSSPHILLLIEKQSYLKEFSLDQEESLLIIQCAKVGWFYRKR